MTSLLTAIISGLIISGFVVFVYMKMTAYDKAYKDANREAERNELQRIREKGL